MVALMERPAETEQQPPPSKVLNRRLNRQAANAIKAQSRGELLEQERRAVEDARRREREKNKKEIARRMVRRMLHGLPRHPIQTEHEYWLALRCGWDFASPELAVDRWGERVDAALGHSWCWWRTLHYETREKLIRLSKQKTGVPSDKPETPRENHSTMRDLLCKYRDFHSGTPTSVPLLNGTLITRTRDASAAN